MSVPAVSVLMPSYGHAEYVAEAIQSVLEQTWTDWELVVVDDCSPDDSNRIIRSFADPRIRLFISEVNRGTYGAQERALQLAEGSLIAILNSDDLWTPRKLEVQVELLKR